MNFEINSGTSQKSRRRESGGRILRIDSCRRFYLLKEHTVAFPADHGSHEPHGIGWFGSELETCNGIARRPLNRRAGVRKIPFEVHRLVGDMRRVDDTAPFHIERDLGGLRETNWKDLGQRTLQIVVVQNARREPERSLSRSKMHAYAVVRNRDRPKHTIRRDVGIVVVNLIGPDGTIIEVQSDEPECPIIVTSIYCDIFADHKTHVGLEGEYWKASARTEAANAIETDESIEVGDLRRLGDIRDWCAGGRYRKVMDRHPKWRDSPGNRIRGSINVRVAILGGKRL